MTSTLFPVGEDEFKAMIVNEVRPLADLGSHQEYRNYISPHKKKNNVNL